MQMFEKIKVVRLEVQGRLGFGITEAQDWCANALHTTRRAYQHWERGERSMHPAFWELLNIKVDQLKRNAPDKPGHPDRSCNNGPLSENGEST